MIDNKIYLVPGMVVQLKQDLPNKPKMIVDRVVRSILKNKTTGHDILKGVRCRWFTDNGFLQEAIFSTKDLILIES